ncbi:hypothetical protein ACQEVS_28430 [Streptomyces sp. CA-181903]|uniref:hypothetical protein n=1 Tax=Streptomyces sp. CA-181903 TaxID=3240055 RepID=UPI003D8CF031
MSALLRAAGARFLVTETPYGPGDFAGRVRYADDPEVCGALARLSDEPLGGAPDPEDVAYVMRVPTVAGPPLSVAVTHRGLAHHLASVAREFSGTGDAGAAVLAPVASEGAVAGLWAPLWAGRRVLLAPRGPDAAVPGSGSRRPARSRVWWRHVTNWRPWSPGWALPSEPDRPGGSWSRAARPGPRRHGSPGCSAPVGCLPRTGRPRRRSAPC